MKSKSTCSLPRVTKLVTAAFILLLAMAPGLMGSNIGYVQTNLVSNSSATPAAFTDPNLINPWGNVSNGGSPFWASDQGTGLSTLYATPPGTPLGLVVSVPAVGTPPATGPTGIVANTTGFDVNGNPAAFIFSTLDGTIAGWNGSPTLTQAVTEATVPGAVFTGLAEASNATGTFLFASDFANNKIDVFNSSYASVSLAGSFTDPSLPAGYAPYNIQTINGNLYVEYAPIGSNGLPVVGPGNGIVDVFDTNGNFVQRLISNGGALNVPWGITLAPAGFGRFGGDLLVGNFGNGWINAFDPTTGAFLGTMDLVNGTPFAEPALWSLYFGVGGSGGTLGVLYFTSGLTLAQTGGLLGSLAPTPEPATLVLLGSGLIGLLRVRRRKA
jgi:uncharacterized protein (TIGR03118 family)